MAPSPSSITLRNFMKIGMLSLVPAMLETLERFGTHIAKGGNRFQLSSLVP